jgi:preprotein translocase subunit SecE
MIKGNNIYRFYEQVKEESYKIIWPSRKELLTSTAIVMAVVFVLSLLFLGLDYGIHSIVQILLNIGK